MLLMTLSEEENRTGIVLLIDAGSARYLFVAMHWIWTN